SRSNQFFCGIDFDFLYHKYCLSSEPQRCPAMSYGRAFEASACHLSSNEQPMNLAWRREPSASRSRALKRAFQKALPTAAACLLLTAAGEDHLPFDQPRIPCDLPCDLSHRRSRDADWVSRFRPRYRVKSIRQLAI